jgi:hypothetical protein
MFYQLYFVAAFKALQLLLLTEVLTPIIHETIVWFDQTASQK